MTIPVVILTSGVTCQIDDDNDRTLSTIVIALDPSAAALASSIVTTYHKKLSELKCVATLDS